MSVLGDTPPRWLRWADTSGTRAVATIAALVAMGGSGLLFFRLQDVVDCLAAQQRADAQRTAVIAAATDAERRADAALVAGPTPGGPDTAELRRLDIEARDHTDQVRAANPAPAVTSC